MSKQKRPAGLNQPLVSILTQARIEDWQPWPPLLVPEVQGYNRLSWEAIDAQFSDWSRRLDALFTSGGKTTQSREVKQVTWAEMPRSSSAASESKMSVSGVTAAGRSVVAPRSTTKGDLGVGSHTEGDEKLRGHLVESGKKETVLLLRLTSKEHEIAHLERRTREQEAYKVPTHSQLRSLLIDPAVNNLFGKSTKELDITRRKLEDSQNELTAWKFTPDSQTGKRLMSRCNTLLQENDELGKQIVSGRIAQLEGDISLQRVLVGEMKKSHEEADELLGDLDEDMEGMQNTIYLLQSELKDSRTNNAELNSQLKDAQLKHRIAEQLLVKEQQKTQRLLADAADVTSEYKTRKETADDNMTEQSGKGKAGRSYKGMDDQYGNEENSRYRRGDDYEYPEEDGYGEARTRKYLTREGRPEEVYGDEDYDESSQYSDNYGYGEGGDDNYYDDQEKVTEGDKCTEQGTDKETRGTPVNKEVVEVVVDDNGLDTEGNCHKGDDKLRTSGTQRNDSENYSGIESESAGGTCMDQVESKGTLDDSGNGSKDGMSRIGKTAAEEDSEPVRDEEIRERDSLQVAEEGERRIENAVGRLDLNSLNVNSGKRGRSSPLNGTAGGHAAGGNGKLLPEGEKTSRTKRGYPDMDKIPLKKRRRTPGVTPGVEQGDRLNSENKDAEMAEPSRTLGSPNCVVSGDGVN